MLSNLKGLMNRPLIRYGFAVSMAVVGFWVRLILSAHGAPGLPTYITFYPAIMVVAMVAGLWPGIVVTMTVGLIADYAILPPHGFGVESVSDAVGLVFFSGMGVFMSLVAEFYRRARAQVEKSSLELRKANEALRQLSSRLLSAHEEERKKIATEIHDTLGSCLTAIKFKMDSTQGQDEKVSNGPTESLNTVIPLVQECIQECRRIQMDLRPSMIDDLGLLPTLSWFCRRFETVYSHIRTELAMTVEEAEIPSPLKIVIYRIAQEAMNNIAKHSKANTVRLSLRRVDRKMEVTIQDNGRGFDIGAVISRESPPKGLGLSSMKERVELSGGSFHIESSEGKGTIIQASWPLDENS